MAEKSTRRKFLAGLLGVLGTPVIAKASGSKTGHGQHDMKSAPAAQPHKMPAMGHGHAGHGMGPMHAWRDPKMPISPPPKTMGHQMGTVHTLNVPALGYELDGNVKVYTVIAQPVEHLFTDGKPKASWEIIAKNNRFTGNRMDHAYAQKGYLWGYNGQVPGPTIECNQGDTIRVVLKNELPEPTSIHWHGLEVANEMDGAGGTTEPVTPPGGTRIYEFKLHQSGTFMYHTGFNMMKQDGLGLGGFVVIQPKDYKYKIDKDVAIMLQAFALAPGSEYPNLATMDFNWFTFNGKTAPDVEVITVKQGERVRLRFGNLTMSSHPIHMHGYTWHVVGTEGGPIPEAAQWPGNTINIPPGTTRDVEFVAWNPGVWRIHCHKLHHTMNAHAEVPMGVMSVGGMFTLLNVIPKDGGHSHG